MYGKTAFGLAEELGISRTEAKKMIDEYFTRYSKVKSFLDSQVHYAHEQGFVSTIMGRKRMLPEIKSKNPMMRNNAERMAMNSPIQGTASDLIKVAMIRVAQALNDKKLESKMMLQVHDELVFECPKSEVEQMKDIVRDSMENALKLNVPLSVNISTGKNWAEL